ncbi:hypothetical protein F4775DRAFT_554177 [Biscogniauxia sp. FL1348]|nr:hypothetical protein F4775DRAFT_554177 [Biscogniauxia sp. FL1348]
MRRCLGFFVYCFAPPPLAYASSIGRYIADENQYIYKMTITPTNTKLGRSTKYDYDYCDDFSTVLFTSFAIEEFI